MRYGHDRTGFRAAPLELVIKLAQWKMQQVSCPVQDGGAIGAESMNGQAGAARMRPHGHASWHSFERRGVIGRHNQVFPGAAH